MSNHTSRNVLIVLGILVLATGVGALIYEFVYKKHRKSPIQPPGFAPYVPMQPTPPYSPSPHYSPSPSPHYSPSPNSPTPSYVLHPSKLSVTNLSSGSNSIQDIFNYVDWDGNSKYFMINDINFYTKGNLNESWNYTPQINYVTNDDTHWYMQMYNPTTFQHAPQGSSAFQTASFANILSPNGLYYIVGIAQNN